MECHLVSLSPPPSLAFRLLPYCRRRLPLSSCAPLPLTLHPSCTEARFYIQVRCSRPSFLLITRMPQPRPSLVLLPRGSVSLRFSGLLSLGESRLLPIWRAKLGHGPQVGSVQGWVVQFPHLILRGMRETWPSFLYFVLLSRNL